MIRKILICFAAGCLGALINSLVVWQAGELGITGWAGVTMKPALQVAWLYPRIIWGGLWGLLFLPPILNAGFLLRTILLSLIPTAVQLFYFFPYTTRYGLMGIKLGVWTPAFVLIYNWIWAMVTGLAIKYSE